MLGHSKLGFACLARCLYFICCLCGCNSINSNTKSTSSASELVRRSILRRDARGRETLASFSSTNDGTRNSQMREMWFGFAPAPVPSPTLPRAFCFDAAAWHASLTRQRPSRTYSQGNQDGVLMSLFDSMGSTNNFYVEFGFSQNGYWETTWPWSLFLSNTGSNTQLLHEHGWHGLLLDGDHEAAQDNLHKEFITPQNVVSLFKKYSVPEEPDYVSIDMDSCDLWIFLNLTEHFRPRVFTIEYNSNYNFDESVTNRCVNAAGERYVWNSDDMYGASLAAIQKAAEQRGYTIVYVESHLDVFLVRRDLVCKDKQVPFATFRNETPYYMWLHKTDEVKQIWTQTY